MKPLNLKIYGLPRSYTNWVAYNIMKTWPNVKVWMNNAPFEPKGEKFWKHGNPEIIEGIDGYIFCKKPVKAWILSIERYQRQNIPSKLNLKYANFVHLGWEYAFGLFGELLDGQGEQHFMFDPIYDEEGYIHHKMKFIFEELQVCYDLPQAKFHYEEKKMWRNGDATSLDSWLTDEDQFTDE